MARRGWGLFAAGAALLAASHSLAQQDTEAPLADLDAQKGVAPRLSIASSLPYNGDPFGTRAWLARHGVTFGFVYTTEGLANVRGGINRAAVFGGMDEVGHLAGGHVMEIKVAAPRQRFVEFRHGRTEQGFEIRFDPSMGVILHKDPVGPDFDRDSLPYREAKTLQGRWVRPGKVSVLDPRENTPGTALPVQGERALDRE